MRALSHFLNERAKQGIEETTSAVPADYDLDCADVHRSLPSYYDPPDEIREVRKQRRTIPEETRVVYNQDDLDPMSRATI